jgi:hypothetical protein
MDPNILYSSKKLEAPTQDPSTWFEKNASVFVSKNILNVQDHSTGRSVLNGSDRMIIREFSE